MTLITVHLQNVNDLTQLLYSLTDSTNFVLIVLEYNMHALLDRVCRGMQVDVDAMFDSIMCTYLYRMVWHF